MAFPVPGHPSLVKPARWPIQPHLTAAPELWRNCLSFVPFWEGSGLPYDIARGLQGSLVQTGGSDGAVNWASDTTGQVAQSISLDPNNTDTNGEAFQFPSIDLSGVSRLAIVGYGRIDKSKTDSVARYLSVEYGGNDDFRVFSNNSASEIWAEFDDGSTTARLKDLGFDEIPQLILLQIDNDTGVQELWVNGVLADSSSGESPVDFNGANGTFGVGSNGNLAGGEIFTTVLWGWAGVFAEFFSGETIRKLNADPFALIRPGPQLIPTLFSGAGATGGLVSLSGASAATTALSGRLSASRTIQGFTAATTTTSGSLYALRAVTGSADAQTSVQGALAANRGLAGTSAAQTTTAGRVSIRRAISGAVTATTTLTGALSKSAKVLLSGTATAVTSLSGRLSAHRGVSGTAPAQTTMTARIGIRRAVSAVAQATTTTAGALSIRRAVSGVVNVVSTLTGALSISAATKRFSAVGRTRGKLRSGLTRGKLRSGLTRGKLRFSGKTKGK
jgi:hypothetical protein